MLQNFQTFQKRTFTDILEIIYPSPPILDNDCQRFYAILLYLFACACAMIVYFSGPYFTLKRNALYSEDFNHLKKLSIKALTTERCILILGVPCKKNLCLLELSVSCNFALFWTMDIKRIFWTFEYSKSIFYWKPIKCSRA